MGNTIGSGMTGFFDVNTIVDKLTQYQQFKIKLLQQDESDFNDHKALYSNLQTFLSDKLQKNLQNLKTALSSASFVASSSDASILTAKVNDSSNLTAGTHEVTVTALAAAEVVSSVKVFADKSAELNVNETLNFTIGAKSFSVAIAPTDSLVAVRDKINAASDNVGVTASIMTTTAQDGSTESRLVVSSRDTGIANKVSITGDTGNVFDLTQQMSVASDAAFTIDGLSVVRSSNYINDVLDGVAFNLLSVTPNGTKVKMTIASSTEDGNASITTALNDMVSAYNQLIEFVGKNQGNKISRDNTLPSVKSAMVNAFQTPFASGVLVKTLTDMGINVKPATSITSEDGKTTIPLIGELTVDTAKLPKMLNESFDAIKTFFLDGNDGFIKNVTSALQTVGTSIADKKTDLDKEIRELDRRIDMQETNLESMKESLIKKYIAANLLIDRLEKTSTFLDVQLKSLRGSDK